MWSEEIKKNCRTIITGLKGQKMLSVLQSVEGQLSDGMWENSPRMESYWLFESVGLDDKDNVVLYISNSWGEYCYNRCKYNAFCGMTDKDIKEWFANKIKQIVKEEIKDWHTPNMVWKRDCEVECCYMHDNLTVKDCYEAYDILKERR